MSRKIKLSFWQILNMNVGFFGIQYSFGLQQSAVTPIYDFLGASADQIPILHLAGPVTGLLVQPIIGAMSDKTWSPKLGRRKPYFLIGAILCSLALLVFPFSSSLWMAAGLLWILDVGNNTAMEPYRALIADKLDDEQQPLGFQMQSFFTGLGQVLANLSIFIFPLIIIGSTGALPTWVYASFFLGAFCSIASILWSISRTKEIPPTAEELAKLKSEKRSVIGPLVEIFSAIKDMPRVMWQLALVYLFQWYALFCYWQNASKSVALSVWNVTPVNKEVYSEAVSWTALVNGWYNIVTFLVAFALVGFAKRFSAKKVHAVCLLLTAIGFLAFPHIANKNLLFFAITGFGIGWASMMGIPYLIVVSNIPKERYGVYMGIINMMIVIPMIIQTLSFGYILKNFLNNDPRNAITFAGVLLIIGAFCTMLIKSNNNNNNNASA
ncbi:MAG: MFS transporter [Patiriisocius sp.]|uniref:MFS transporter n=1 Tax=Patiriisocius sp. TaxID=2822396 RepID=UPI003EF68B44